MPTISPSSQIYQQNGDHTYQESEHIVLDFRAPPPSPIGSSRRASTVTNEEVLTEFLENSLKVPDLILPNKIFPKQNPLTEIPIVDFRSTDSYPDDLASRIMSSLAEFGCFQVINHGISQRLIKSAVRRTGRIFRLSPEKKRLAVRSPELPLGFEEVSGDQEEVISEMSEEFVWGKSYGFKLKMEGILPCKYSKFSEKMEDLALAIEKVARDIMLMLMKDNSYNGTNDQGASIRGERHDYNDNKSTTCHIYKHPHDVPADQCINSLRYDVISMMLRGSDYSHSLSLHLCDGSSKFHVYSKKGWTSFIPLNNALVVTAGDQIQAWSGGRYKHVIGKPIYACKSEDCISMAFLYSAPPSTSTNNQQQFKTRIISLREQALFAIFFTIIFQFLLQICNIL